VIRLGIYLENELDPNGEDLENPTASTLSEWFKYK
jgi:hypothetical protein